MILKIELLDSRKHIRSDFCCGKDSLDKLLVSNACQNSLEQV
jgi:hypothetical protein